MNILLDYIVIYWIGLHAIISWSQEKIWSEIVWKLNMIIFHYSFFLFMKENFLKISQVELIKIVYIL